MAFLDKNVPRFFPLFNSFKILRGLRLWVSMEEEENTDEKKEDKKEKNSNCLKVPLNRVLLGFRDFVPSVEGKNVFSDEYDSLDSLLDKVNSYLLDRVTPARILSLQTLVFIYFFINVF